MKKVVLVVEYLGKEYCGFSRQKNALSVQQVLEEAWLELTGEQIKLVCAGRTDAGVSAKDQHVHFETDTKIPTGKLDFALNALLPCDIRILDSFEAEPDFHARYSAKSKHYRYTVLNRQHNSAIYFDTVWHVPGKLDIEAMKREIKSFEGTHDFSAFMASGGQTKTTVRTIYRAQISQDGDFIYLDFFGNGFLYNMVRIMAGTLVYVGQGKITNVEEIIESKKRKMAGKTAPPQGLMLMKVEY